MFSVEIKINGSMIQHIHGHNEGFIDSGKRFDTSKYTYDVYDVESHKLKKGEVIHDRSDGIGKLIGKILIDAECK